MIVLTNIPYLSSRFRPISSGKSELTTSTCSIVAYGSEKGILIVKELNKG